MSDDWKTYRTRFVVRARQLSQPFSFTDTNGHEHHGRPGDYVIESREGLRISRREIFEDVYVAMEAVESNPICSSSREVLNAGGHGSIAQTAAGHDFTRAEIVRLEKRGFSPSTTAFRARESSRLKHDGTGPFRASLWKRRL